MTEFIDPHQPEPALPVKVRRHRVDWESDDLAEVTAQRALSLGPELASGCWYLNPRYTVSCPAPTGAYFRRVRELRSSWLYTCREYALGNHGLQREARKVRSEGRRGALLDPGLAELGGVPNAPPPDPSDARLREATQAGRTARNLAFGGVLYIDGELIPPRTWRPMADRLLRPSGPSSILVARRGVDLAALKATGDPGPLVSLGRSALQEHLDDNPWHAAYVCPEVTVWAPAATPAFYEAARSLQARWCTRLNRTLGCGNVRRARRDTDEATVALAYGGTLVVDGLLYLPGCWPTDAPGRSRLKQTPFGAPTVPPAYLGLIPPDAPEPPDPGPGTD